MRDELLPHRLGRRRSVMLEARKPGAQRAFARSTNFVSNRVIVSEVERTQEGPKGQSLDGEGAEHDRECRQHDHVAKWKHLGQRQRCRKRDDATRMPAHEMTRPLPTEGRSIGRGG